jgi:hypothetical protein
MLDLNLEWLEVRELRQKEGKLRKRERQISAMLEKVGEDFMKTMKAREIVGKKADELERKLLESQGRVKYLRTRKSTPRASNSESKRAEMVARAVQLATEGKLEEAVEMMKRAK